MAFDPKYLTLAQLALEALLVVLLLLILRRSKAGGDTAAAAKMPDNLKEAMERFISESDRISAAFAENLKNKKELSADLILKLDRRLSEYRNLLRETEESFGAARKKMAEAKAAAAPAAPSGPPAESAKANPAAPEVRALVLQLARKGLPPEEIAAKARLHLGEVELIIDLERQFNM